MTKLLRSTALSALALLFVACDPALDDEAIQALAAEAQEEDPADGLVVPYHLVADDGDDDGPADPTPFFDLDRLTTEDPGCATGGEEDAELELAGVQADDGDGDDEDLDLAPARADRPDPGADAPALDLVADAADPSASEDDEDDEDDADELPLKADVDPTEEDTSGYEPEPTLAGA